MKPSERYYLDPGLVWRHRDSEAPISPAVLAVKNHIEEMLNYAIEPVDCLAAADKCFQLGLSITSGEVQIFKRDNELVIQPTVPGYTKIFYRSNKIDNFIIRVVRQNDIFELETTHNNCDRFIHMPEAFGDSEIVGVYIAVYMDGGDHCAVEWISRAEVDRRREMARDTSVWDNHLEEMAKKTLMHTVAKRLPLNSNDRAVMNELRDIEFTLPEKTQALSGQEQAIELMGFLGDEE